LCFCCLERSQEVLSLSLNLLVFLLQNRFQLPLLE
jgi:hypothetical protein